MSYTKAEMIVMPTAFLIIVGVGFILRFLLRNRSDKAKNVPLTVIAITLIVMEIVKEIYYVCIDDWSTWDIPLHFCSFFLFWFAFAQFSKANVKQLGYSCALCGGVLMTIMFYIGPSSIINNACANPFASFSSMHTFFFHFFVVAYTVWLIMLGLYKPKWKHIWQTTLIYFVYFVVICIFAHLLNTNFTNALYSNIPFMESLRVKCGQVLYTIVMFAFGCASIACLSSIFNIVKPKR